MTDLKWLEERAENIEIGDVIMIQGNDELFITKKVVGFTKDVFFHGMDRKGKYRALTPCYPAFLCWVRAWDYAPAMLPDMLPPDENYGEAAGHHDLLKCKVKTSGFTPGRSYLVFKEDACDKFVLDDFNRERSCLCLDLNHFEHIP